LESALKNFIATRSIAIEQWMAELNNTLSVQADIFFISIIDLNYLRNHY